MRRLITILYLPIFLYAYSLEELVEISQQNKVVESATHMLNSKEKAYESTTSSYLPTIDVGTTYQNVSKETPSVAKELLRYQASVKYTIYDGGKKRTVYDQLTSTIDASKKSLEAIKNDISLDVTRLYFEYLSLLSDKESTNQEIKQLEAEFTRLEMFLKTGSITKDELDKINSRVMNANVTLNEIDLAIQKVLHTLEYYTGKKIDTIKSGSTIKVEDVLDSSTRADIEALEYQAKAALHEANSKKSAYLPTLSLENTATFSDYYFDVKPTNSYLVDKQNTAAVNLSWNVFDFGATTKSYESKFEEYLSKKSEVDYQKDVADVDFRLAKKSLEIAHLKVASTKATLEAASSTYELVKLKYQNGTIDNIAYLQALSEKFDAQRGYDRALYDLEVKKAELIYYSGKNIKEYI